MSNLKYFKSFRGYGKPLKPVGELAFADTADLPTFYLGWFGPSGQLLRLRKIAVTKRGFRPFVLKGWIEPESTVYFTVGSRSDEPITWRPISYDATESLLEYYEGRVNSSGLGGEATHVERLTAFTEGYNENASELQRGHAILIATEESADPRLPPIKSAKLDASRVAGALVTSRFARFDSIATLTNSRTSDILKQMKTSIESVRNDEVLLLYFSGHSLVASDGDVLLSTGDTNLKDVHHTSISMRMLADKFSTCKGRILLFLDCCYSGKTSKRQELRVIDTFRQLHQSDKVAVLASRRLIENSTNALSEPLACGLLGQADMNQDGIIGTDELLLFINRNLNRTLYHAPNFHWFLGYGNISSTDLSAKPDSIAE